VTSKKRSTERRARAAELAAAAKAREREAAEQEMAAASDVIPGLKILGFRGDDLPYAARLAAEVPDAPTEVRMAHAIRGLGRASLRRLTHVPRSPV